MTGRTESERRLVFVSNLFPDAEEDYRGLDNATLLHALADGHGVGVRVLALRPTFWPGQVVARPRARVCDRRFEPRYVQVPYVPRVGGGVNHRLVAVRLRGILRRLVARARAQVVLVSWLYPDGCAVARCLMGSGVRVVMVAQGTDVHDYLERPLRRGAIVRAAGRVERTVARSGDLKRRLVEAGVDEGRVEVVYNGVDAEVFGAAAGAGGGDRGRCGVAEGERVLLFVGNLRPVKDPMLLLEAHARVVAASPGERVRLVLVGQGEMRAELEARAGALGTAELVTFAGPMAAPEVAAWMAVADVLCISSVNEGLPNVLLEAMMSGLPVVSTDVGGIGEVLRPGRHGMLVPAGDVAAFAAAVREVLQVPPDRGQIARDGAVFRWPRAAAAYAGLLWPGGGTAVVEGVG